MGRERRLRIRAEDIIAQLIYPETTAFAERIQKEGDAFRIRVCGKERAHRVEPSNRFLIERSVRRQGLMRPEKSQSFFAIHLTAPMKYGLLTRFIQCAPTARGT